MPGLRVLITSFWISERGGTELYVRDLAIGLLRAGHQPMVWSPILGAVAADIRAAGVPVYDDLAAVKVEPDVIHGQHGDETRAALSRFPEVPAVYLCHDAEGWQDEPPLHSRILRYLAVDELCRQRVLARGVPPQRTAVVPNSVDLDRFTPRTPLPPRPSRALLFANTARPDSYTSAVQEGCARAGVELDVVGIGSGNVADRPEQLLGDYDVVFGKARAALEALAVGCAVILCDLRGVGGMVTARELPELRRWNLGRRLLTGAHTPVRITEELLRYDPEDARRCSEQVRATAGLTSMVRSLLDHYEDVLAESGEAEATDPRAELVELSTHLQTIGPLRLDGHRRTARIEHAEAVAADLHEGLAAARERARLLEEEIAALAGHTRAVEQERDRRTADALELREALDAIRNGRTMRWRNRLIRLTGREATP